MKKYLVNVNGTNYEVALEVMAEGAAPTATVAPVAAAAPTAAGGEQVKSPMPGTIVAVKVAVGDAVKKGQTLLVLEAMKMENEILAPKAGTIASVNTSKGASVNTGDALISLA